MKFTGQRNHGHKIPEERASSGYPPFDEGTAMLVSTAAPIHLGHDTAFRLMDRMELGIAMVVVTAVTSIVLAWLFCSRKKQLPRREVPKRPRPALTENAVGWIVWVAAALPVVVFTVFVVLANWPSGSENAGPSLAGHDGEIVAASKETTCILKTQCGGPPPSWWQQAWDWLNDFGLPYLAMTIAGASLAALLLGLAWWSWRKSRGLTAASSAPAPAGSSPTRPA